MPDNEDWFNSIDPILYAYMRAHWEEDQEEYYQISRNLSILTGSFYNPTAAKAMLKPEADFHSSDEDFEKSMEMVKEDKKKNQNKEKKRIRKKRLQAEATELKHNK